MDVFDLTATIKLDSSEFESGLDKASDSANKFGNNSKQYDKALRRWNMGAAAATTAIVAFGAASVKTGMKFDASMSQVAATMGVTVDEIQDLRKYAMDMGATTAFSATEAADALNYMALAGYDAQTSMDMLPNVLNLAAAGSIDLAYASDMITDSQSALGLSLDETTELVDKMAMTASKSNTSVAQLGEAMLTVGGTAKNLSGGTTELATALGILADNGIKGAEGGTALRNIILSLTSPTDQAAQLMQQLGLQVFDTEGNMRSLNDIFTDLDGILGNMTQEEKMNVLSELFNKVDLKSANALLANTGDRFNELSGYIDQAKGSAEQMANTQLDNLAGDVTLLKSAFEGLQIEVSDKLSPALRVGVQGLTELIGHAGEIAGALAPAIGAFAAFTVAINIGNIISSVASAIQGLWMVIAANPIGLAIALMAGLGIAAYNLVTHFGELYTEADKAAEGIRNLNRATESSVSAYAEADAAAGEAVSNIKSKVSQMATETVARMGEGGTEGGAQYKANLLAQLNEIDPGMAAVVENAMSNSAALAQTYGTDGGTQYADGFVHGAEQLEGTISTATENEMSAANAAAKEGAAQATSSGAAFGSNLTSGLQSTASAMASAASSAVASAVSAARGAASGASAIGVQISNGIASGVMAAAGRIASAAASAVSNALAAAKAAAAIASPSKKFRDEVGVFMGLGVAEGLEKSEDKAVQAAVKLAQETYSKAQEWLRRNAKFNKWTLEDQLAVWQEIQAGFIKGSKQYLDAEEQIFDLREKMSKEYYDGERKRIQKAIKYQKLSKQEQIKAWRELRDQYQKDSDEYVEIDETIYDLRADLADDYRDKVEDIWKSIGKTYTEYADTLKDRIKQIADSYGLFDDVQDRYRINSQELITNLQRQVNVLNDFYGGLDKLSERGVSEVLVQEIRDMGPQAVDQLDALLAMTDAQLEKYVSLYDEKQALANKTALKELEGLKAETAEEIKNQLKELDKLYNDNSGELGETFAKTVADGIKQNMGEVARAAMSLANEANRAFYAGLDSRLSSGFGSSKVSQRVSFAQSGLGSASAQIVNTLSSTARNGNTTQTINLVTPYGDTLAKYVFDPLKNYAASKGQPIVAAT